MQNNPYKTRKTTKTVIASFIQKLGNKAEIGWNLVNMTSCFLQHSKIYKGQFKSECTHHHTHIHYITAMRKHKEGKSVSKQLIIVTVTVAIWEVTYHIIPSSGAYVGDRSSSGTNQYSTEIKIRRWRRAMIGKQHVCNNLSSSTSQKQNMYGGRIRRGMWRRQCLPLGYDLE